MSLASPMASEKETDMDACLRRHDEKENYSILIFR
jgi:hypothetical protein